LQAKAIEARFCLKNLAKLCGVSVRQLEIDFNQEVHSHPAEWLRFQRCTFALKELGLGKSVKEASTAAFYSNPSQFCRVTRRLFRASPRQVIRQLASGEKGLTRQKPQE
jgi:AraC-like DNA-binding protein